MRFIGFAIYVGIGALLHAAFVGPQFDWSSAWTFGWLFGWPLMLLGASWVVLIIVGVVYGMAWAGWEWLTVIANWRERRRTR